MNQSTISPPKWQLKLLRLFLKKEYIEEIEGDLEALFADSIEQGQSYRQAKRMYTWEVVKLLRPILMKNFKAVHAINHYPMFKNYFKTSFRSLMKNPLSSFINVFGLAVATGICLVVYTFMEFDQNIDQFHKNKNEVYLITFFAGSDSVTQQYGTTPRPLGDVLKQDFAQVKKVCRVEDRDVVLKYKDNVFHERVRYTDAAFLELFTFPLKWGTANSLSDLNSIVLSEEMSTKYFGDEHLMVFNDTIKKAFTVTGVAAAFPNSRDLDFNFLINFENVRVSDPGYDRNDWSKFLNATLIQVDNATDVKSIESKMEKYRAMQNDAQPDWAISSFAFERFATLHENAANIKTASPMIIMLKAGSECQSLRYL